MTSRQSRSDGLGALPTDIQQKIYRMILVVPAELHIFQDHGGPIEVFAPEKSRQWNALLHVSRPVSKEASTVLYGSNVFNFLDTSTQQASLMKAFLERIGSINANHLTHLCVNFPLIEYNADASELSVGSWPHISLLRKHCANLKRLELYVNADNNSSVSQPETNAMHHLKTELRAFSTQLHTLPALQNIIIRFYGQKPLPSVVELMQSLHWIVLKKHEACPPL